MHATPLSLVSLLPFLVTLGLPDARPTAPLKMSLVAISFVLAQLTTDLHAAAAAGDVAKVYKLVKAGSKLEYPDASGHTALHEAAFNGRTNTVAMLLEEGAALDATTADGVTALHLAAASGEQEVAELLLDRGLSVNTQGQNHGDTPLHRAVGNGKLKMAELLMQRGAAIQGDKYGYTPLHTAASTGNLAAVQLMLANGADIDAKNEEGKTPLMLVRKALAPPELRASLTRWLDGSVDLNSENC